MALEQVGLEYVSKNVTDFISKANEATKSVGILNTKLLESEKSSKSYQKTISGVTPAIKQLNDEFKNQENVVKGITPALKELNNYQNNTSVSMQALHRAQKLALDGFSEFPDSLNNSASGIRNVESRLSSARPVLNDVSGGLSATATGAGLLSSSVIGLSRVVYSAEGALFGHRNSLHAIMSQYINLPPSIQNAIDRAEKFTNTLMRSNSILGMVLRTLNSYVKFKDVFAFLKFDESAKDAHTFSKAIADSGRSLNRVENTIRGFSLGLLLIAKRTKQAEDELMKLRKGLLVLAKGVDKVSDFFGDWSKEVKNGDKELQDFNKEQRISTKETKINTGELIKNGQALYNIGDAALKVKGSISDIRSGEDRSIVGDTIDLISKGFFAKNVNNFAKTYLGLPSLINPVTVAIGAATVAWMGLSKVLQIAGGRAAGLTAMSDSFERLRVSAGLSTDFLQDFAESADNQLTQAQLLEKTNKALAGSQGEFQKELAGTLPTLLEFGRVRAAATGEDVGFLFESLIQGIKKGQPLILDNLGLVVKLDEVNTKYAQSIGKTVEQLTAQEKQLALLQSVEKEAIRNIDILGEATLSNADKMAAKANIFSDIFDSISLAVQPLLGVVLDIEIQFTKWLQEGIQPLLEVFGFLMQVIGDVVNVLWVILSPVIELVLSLWNALTGVIIGILAPIKVLWNELVRSTQVFQIFGTVLRPIIDLLNGVGFLFRTVGEFIAGLINFVLTLRNAFMSAIGDALAPFVNFMDKNVFGVFANVKDIIQQTAVVLSFGFGKAAAAMVNTFAKAARDILKLVADLAQGIADFLIGQSPPPKGPLSKIDSGGQKTFEAFLDGFSKATLKPVQVVAAKVDAELGKIGQMSIGQVENRLKQLDLAIRPFSEQLEIAKARFESISEPANAALNAIDRQLDTAIQALVKGDASAKASVQALDAQRAALHKNLDLQQQQVDFAQIQFAMAKARQAEERKLLEIQKARLGPQKELAQTTVDAAKAATTSATAPETKTGGAGVTGEGELTSGGEITGTTGNEFTDLMFAGFESELDMDLFGQIGDEQARLGEQGVRIGEGLAGIGNKFLDPFKKIFGEGGTVTTLFKDFFGEGGKVQTLISDLFGEDGVIKTKIDGFVTFITDPLAVTGKIATSFNDVFGESGAIRSSISGFTTWASSLFGEQGTLATSISGLFGEDGTVTTMFEERFGEDGTVRGLFNQVFGEEGIIRLALTNVGTYFTEFKNLIFEVFELIGLQIFGGEESFGTIMNNMFGEEGVVKTLLWDAEIFFANMFDAVFGEEGVFSKVADQLKDLVAMPILLLLTGIQGVLNSFIELVEGFINDQIGAVAGLVEMIPEHLRGPLGGIVGSSVQLPRVQFVAPDINLKGAAKGGLFSGGMLRVGERGEEIVSSAGKMAVFPNNFVTAIKSLEQTIASAMYIQQGASFGNNGGGSSSVTNQTFNFNQPMNPVTTRQQLTLVG